MLEARGHTDRRIAETIVETNSAFSDGVNVGRQHGREGIAIAAERIRSQLITVDPEYIWFFHWSNP